MSPEQKYGDICDDGSEDQTLLLLILDNCYQHQIQEKRSFNK